MSLPREGTGYQFMRSSPAAGQAQRSPGFAALVGGADLFGRFGPFGAFGRFGRFRLAENTEADEVVA